MNTKLGDRPVADLLEAPLPEVDDGEAGTLAQRLYGLSGGVTPLVSERDRNFKLRRSDGSAFVLKIANAAEDPDVLDLQTRALQWVAERDPTVPVPRVCPSLHGRAMQSVEVGGRHYVVRLLTYLEGELMSKHAPTVALRRETGAVLARLGRALRGMFHPAAGRDLAWDFRHALQLRPYVDRIEDASRRDLATSTLERFEQAVAPALPRLRAQLIHNDLNPENVVVHSKDPSRISGVIDFGDMVHAPIVADLAIAVAYQLFEQADVIGAACDVVSGYHANVALEQDELGLLMDLVATRLAMSGIISSWRVSEHPENREYIQIHEPYTWPTLEEVSVLSRVTVRKSLYDVCGISAGQVSFTSTESLRARRRKYLGPTLKHSYDEPLHLVRGDGVWMFDTEGRRYLDAYNNVAHVGHAHPTVAAALARQSRTLNTNTRYLHEHIVDYAERLAGTMPGDLSVCLFVCSGTEANDLAWRIAKAVSGSDGAIVADNAYHGNSNAVMQLSPEELPPDLQEDWVAKVPAPNTYSGPYRAGEADLGTRYADHVDGAIAELKEAGHRPAAVLFDSIFSSDGIRPAVPGYLPAVYEKVRSAGGLCIADEVQSGFGRTGEHMWYFEACGVVPDMVTLGKPMGNGHPLAAVVTTPAVAEAFSKRQHYFNTFGGNPVSCAVGLAVLDVLEQEGLQENARIVGEYLRECMASVAECHPIIGDVRSAGLFMGIELVSERGSREPADETAKVVHNEMGKRGVLVGRTGLHGNVIKVRPPLVFSKANADQLIDTLDRVLKERGGAV